MTQTIVNLGTGGAVLNGRNGSTGGADSNDALFLDWSGQNYVYLPGVAGNSVSVPDEAALDIVGDIEIQFHIRPDTLSATQITIYRADSYEVRIDSLGRLNLRWDQATVQVSKTSTVAVPYVAGEAFWFKATLDVNNGSGGNDVKFYTSDDGVSWTQLGATVTSAGVATIDATANGLLFGNFSTIPFLGAFYRLRVLNGIGGTLVVDIDSSKITSGSNTSFTALTGQTVSINRATAGRKIVAVVSPVWLFGTDDYMTIPTDRRVNFPAGEDRTIIIIYRVWATVLVANAKVFSKNTEGVAPSYEIRGTSAGNLAVFINDGTSDVSSTMTDPTAGSLEMRGMVRNTTTGKLGEIVDGVVNAENNDTLGGVESTSDLYLMSEPGGGAYRDAEMFAFMVFDRVLTDAELTTIDTYYQNKVA